MSHDDDETLQHVLHNSVVKVRLPEPKISLVSISAEDDAILSSPFTTGIAIKTIDGRKRVLTTAFSLEDAENLHVKRPQGPSQDSDDDESFRLTERSHHRTGNPRARESPSVWYEADVYAECTDCDLALLHVPDTNFWKGLDAVPMGDAEASLLRASVVLVGYHDQDDEMTILRGTISRMEDQGYQFSHRLLLAMTVDVSTSLGFAGPVLDIDSGALLGMCFQAIQNDGVLVAELAVPVALIKHFLDGIGQFGPSDYQGMPSCGFTFQHLTNPYLRKQMAKNASIEGVLVTKVTNNKNTLLQARDVIVRIDGVPVANNGTVSYRDGRIDLRAFFALHQCDDNVELEVLREGQQQLITVKARADEPLIPPRYHDRDGEIFFGWAGLVFARVTRVYLENNILPRATLSYLAQLSDQTLTKATTHIGGRGELVVLGNVVPEETVNAGYEHFVDTRIVRVDGEEIKNLQDLKTRVIECKGETIKFETMNGDIIVVPSPKHPLAADMSHIFSLSNSSAGDGTCCVAL